MFGLVAPVGTNFALLQNPLDRCLDAFGYKINVVRFSDLIAKFQVGASPEIAGSEEYVRLNKAMHAGNQLRLDSARGEFLALAAAKSIFEARPDNADDRVRRRTVHVLRSIKHPDEVRALRRIYGSGFFLIGVIVQDDARRKYLGDDRGCKEEEINALLERDEHEEDPRYFGSDGRNYGQRTRDTFQLADVFLPLDNKTELERFLGLVFGNPFLTPRTEEHAMFMAFSSALRSGDLSRQVGAVIVSEAGDLIAAGANDVPRPGGGLYWATADDRRDHVRGEDSNEVQRTKILVDVLKRLRPPDREEAEWLESGKARLFASPLMDITEYGRAVHAEMEALMSCARTGASPKGGTLYSTTFPCHNCAKHIVAAGISRVVYVEPYPKSQALNLFPDSIRLEGQPDDETKGPKGKVVFEPFKGIGPRRFFDLFSISLSSGTRLERKKGGHRAAWSESSANVRVPLLPNSYIEREIVATNELMGLTTEPVAGEIDEKDRAEPLDG